MSYSHRSGAMMFPSNHDISIKASPIRSQGQTFSKHSLLSLTHRVRLFIIICASLESIRLRKKDLKSLQNMENGVYDN